MAFITFDPDPAVQDQPCYICIHGVPEGATPTLELDNGDQPPLSKSETMVVGPANAEGVACGYFEPDSDWDSIVVNAAELAVAYTCAVVTS